MLINGHQIQCMQKIYQTFTHTNTHAHAHICTHTQILRLKRSPFDEKMVSRCPKYGMERFVRNVIALPVLAFLTINVSRGVAAFSMLLCFCRKSFALI
jgi:hypothetical protein